jgi:hypothetical protein
MQTKAREYVCDVFRPVQGVWLSGKKSALLDGVKELVGLVEEMIKAESMEIGRRRPRVNVAPSRAANPTQITSHASSSD